MPAAPPAIPERQRALESALSQIEKAYGKGAIMRLGELTTVDTDA
ncbi:MAG: DNA recombination/repair protein RecA, partial [Chloroflexi bacterium]|nr:DNA recombination/repair protein RecA [Chloroflexota bacterium]